MIWGERERERERERKEEMKAILNNLIIDAVKFHSSSITVVTYC